MILCIFGFSFSQVIFFPYDIFNVGGFQHKSLDFLQKKRTSEHSVSKTHPRGPLLLEQRSGRLISATSFSGEKVKKLGKNERKKN